MTIGPNRVPELVILPQERDATRSPGASAPLANDDVREYFVDARDGDIAFEYSDLQTQSAVGRGTGRARRLEEGERDVERRSVRRERPAPAAGDRTPTTCKGDHIRTASYLNDVIQLTANDLASDSDNTWTDGA